MSLVYQCDNDKISDLKGLKILFFAPAFFGYEYKIAEKMRELGAEVDLYDERSVSSSIDRALLKVSPKIFSRKSKKYYNEIIQNNKGKNYDVILIIKGEMIPIETLIDFRKNYPKARVNLYLYDSVANVPGITKKFKYFDNCHSFDPEDCKRYEELKFEPLFFLDEFCKNRVDSDSYKYDLCFLGTIHSDRYKIIKQIQEFSEKNNLKTSWFLYLQSKFIYFFYKFTRREFFNTKINWFDFEKKASEEIAEIVDDSNVVIDIQHPRQKGLTMRTIEMVGMNKKIITTNESIKKYDFYNSANILVIDRKNVKIDKEFFSTKYKAVDKEIYLNYCLEAWIKTVLN